MRRILAMAAVAALPVSACSSGGSKTAGGLTSTTIDNELAKWLDGLTPPIRGFVLTQADFTATRVGTDLQAQKTEALKVVDAAKALAAAFRASLSTAPTRSSADVQNAVAQLDKLIQIGGQVATCTTNCQPLLDQFTVTFTDTTNATTDLQVKARPVTPVTTTTVQGGTTTTSTTAAPNGSTTTTVDEATTVPATPELTQWLNSYGNDVITAGSALENLVNALQSEKSADTEAACAAFASAVSVVYGDPAAPDATVRNDINDAMSHTSQSYGICKDDP